MDRAPQGLEIEEEKNTLFEEINKGGGLSAPRAKHGTQPIILMYYKNFIHGTFQNTHIHKHTHTYPPTHTPYTHTKKTKSITKYKIQISAL